MKKMIFGLLMSLSVVFANNLLDGCTELGMFSQKECDQIALSLNKMAQLNFDTASDQETCDAVSGLAIVYGKLKANPTMFNLLMSFITVTASADNVKMTPLKQALMVNMADAFLKTYQDVCVKKKAPAKHKKKDSSQTPSPSKGVLK